MNCRHCKKPMDGGELRVRTDDGRWLHVCDHCLEQSPGRPDPQPHRPTVRRQTKYGSQ